LNFQKAGGSVQSSGNPLAAMYNKIVAFTTDQLSPLTDITSRTLKGTHYEILVDCLWVDVVERINKECSSIFAPGMPDIFHKVRIPRSGGRPTSNYFILAFTNISLCPIRIT
jgi:hypothetical protein